MTVSQNPPMIKFTHHSDPKVEQRIQSDVSHIVKAVVHEISPSAIILSGSFGRGEGTVTLVNNHINVVSDYEIAVVTTKFWKRSRILSLSHKLSRELDAEVSLFWLTPSRLKHNRMKNLSFGTATPNIFMYDLKTGSILLYGDANLSDAPLSPSDLPPWEGLRLVLNRMAEMLFKANKIDFQRWAMGESLGTSLPSAKPLLAAADGLLVASGLYRVSAIERLKLFVETNSESVLTQELKPHLNNALNYRMKGEPWKGIPWECFRAFIMSSLRMLLEKTFQLRFEYIEDLPSVFHPSPEKLSPVIQYRLHLLPIPPVTLEILAQKSKLIKAGLRKEIWRFKHRRHIPSLTVHSLIPGLVLLGENNSPHPVIDAIHKSGMCLEDVAPQDMECWTRWHSIRCFLKPFWKAIC